MYAKYLTDAIILGGTPMGEADKRIVLFTKEFGLVHARASAVRRESSKMRYGLQTFSQARVSLVRGVTGWRIVGAVAGTSFNEASRESVSSFMRIAHLLRTLVPEEETNEKLFSILADAWLAFLNQQKKDAQGMLELLCVARILHALGYLSHDALGAAFFSDTMFASDLLERAQEHKQILLTSVNRALSETHL